MRAQSHGPRRGLRRTLTALGAFLLLGALGAGAASAFWSTSAATTNATATASTLKTPAAPSVASTSSTSLTVSGTLPSGQLSGATYTVKRGATTVCSPTAASWSCVDTGLASSTTYSYTLVAGLGSWTQTSPAGSGTTQCASASTYVVGVSNTTPTTGTAFTVTLTAKNCAGVTDTSYSGAKAVVFSGPSASPSGKAPSYPASVTFSNGVGTASVKLYDVETTAITATMGSITGTSPNVTVSAADPYTIMITNPSNKSGAVTIDCNESDDLNEQTHNCAQTSATSTGSNRVWKGYLTVFDQWGNARTNNIGAAITMTVSVSNNGDSTTVSIPRNATSSAQFSLDLPNSGTRTITAVTTNTSPVITIKVTNAG